MASLALALDKAAFAKATGATPKYPSPIFMLPKPKPRPQPLRQDLGNVGDKRKAEEDSGGTASKRVPDAKRGRKGAPPPHSKRVDDYWKQK